jgi:hypothetical protein
MDGHQQARRRPFGLYMVIALILANALALALEAILVYFRLPGATSADLQDLFAVRAVDSLARALLVVTVAVLAALIAVAFGLWRLRRWAWVATMIIIGIGLATDILGYFHGNPHYAGMLVHVLIVFYLNDREVQSLFARRRAGETAA